MSKKEKKINFVLLICLFLIIFPRNSFAYLDPGTGSIILQAIAAIFAGIVTWMSFFKNKIKEYFIKIFSKKSPKKNNKEESISKDGQ